MKFVSGVLGALCLLSLLAAVGAATFWSPTAITRVNLKWPVYVGIGLLFGLLSVVCHWASQRRMND